MSFMQLAKERFSVRKFSAKPVEEDKIQRMLEAGRIAPTAVNAQPQRFLVVQSKESLEKLGKATKLHGATLAVVVCCLKDKAWVRPQDGHRMTDIDPTIATTHIMLQAWEDGIGSCWITWFDPAIVQAEFNLPENVIPVNILAMGYGEGEKKSSDRHAQQRIPLANMVWKETYPGSVE